MVTYFLSTTEDKNILDSQSAVFFSKFSETFNKLAIH